MTWTMVSYAEKLSPGSLYSSSFQPTVCPGE
jgi:hypothetical protein